MHQHDRGRQQPQRIEHSPGVESFDRLAQHCGVDMAGSTPMAGRIFGSERRKQRASRLSPWLSRMPRSGLSARCAAESTEVARRHFFQFRRETAAACPCGFQQGRAHGGAGADDGRRVRGDILRFGRAGAVAARAVPAGTRRSRSPGSNSGALDQHHARHTVRVAPRKLA